MSRALKSLAIFAAVVLIYTLSRHALHSGTTTTTTTATTSTAVATTCQSSDFTAVFNQGQGAAGTIYGSVDLTKTSGADCVIHGYPTLVLQDKYGSVLPSKIVDDSNGSPIQMTDSAANAPASTLAVHAGSVVRFDFAYNDVASGCETVTTLGVQMTSGTGVASVTPQYPLQPCFGGEIWVSPFIVSPNA